MSDPNPITLATVDRLPPLTPQSARSGLQTLLRNGNVVEARVVGMLAGDVAQLEILGQKVEVSTQQALKAGTTISVAINRTGSSLELVIRPDNSGARPAQSPQPAAGLGRGYSAPGEATGSLRPGAVSIENWVLASQAATNEPVLSAETGFQNATLAAAPFRSIPAVQAAYAEAAFAPQAQLQAEMRALYDWEARSSAPPEPSENDDARPPSSADETSQLGRQAAASSPAPEQQDPNSAFAIQVPFQLPQLQRPILLRVEEDDEDEARPEGRSGSAKRWTVNFSLDAGTLGAVHVSIALSASSLTVRLASDQAEILIRSQCLASRTQNRP